MGLFRIVFLSLLLTVFGVGIYDYIYNAEPNGCEMTYMFEYPEYLKIDLNQSLQRKYPRYNLYFYGEGSYAKEAKSANFQPKGIPVLFIPGNAGSYKQVRSLGSVALRMAESLKSNFQFNFFALDLNEEYSGLFGPLLQVQTEFAAECIRHILSMYSGNMRPTTVLVVGHSMGGIVARALFTLPGFDRAMLNTIITQATPHQQPVISLDSIMAEFYEQVNNYWKEHSDEEGKLGDVTVFSTSGGFRDVLVRSGLTSLKGLVQRDRSTVANTMSVPGAWVSTDHLCHVWCKQIVMTTVRALFDIVDKNTRQIAVNPTFRVKPFAHHFVQNIGVKHYKASHDLMLPVLNSSTFEIRKKQAWKYVGQKVEINRIVAVNLPKAVASEYGYVAITNVDNVAWVGGCTVRDGRCTQIGNFARYANLIPQRDSGLKVVQLDSYKLDMFEHWTVIIPKSEKPVTMMYDLYKLAERNIAYNVSNFINFVKNFPSSIYKSDMVIDKTRSRNIFYNISLSELTIPLQAYTAIIETRSCNANSSEGAEYAVAKFHVPWSGEHIYVVIPRGGKAEVPLKLQSGKPEYPVFGNAELHLYLMPQCSYRVSIKIAWKELPGQFFRFYAALLPAYIVMQVLMGLSWQLMALEDPGVVPDFSISHTRWAQPYRVCLVASLIKFLISYPEEDNFAKFLGLPTDDTRTLQDGNMWYAALPVLLYLFSYASIGLFVLIAKPVVILFAKIANLIFGRCMRGTGRPGGIIQYIQYILLTTGAVCSATMCGAFGILITYLIYVFKLWSSYIEGRELATQSANQSVSNTIDDGADDSSGKAGARAVVKVDDKKKQVLETSWNRFNINFSLVLLLLMSVFLNAPSLAIWIENLQWGKLTMDVDPSSSSGVIICIAAILINYSPFPYAKHELTSVMGAISYACCVLMVLYATTSVYRVTHFINASLMVIALPSALVTILDSKKQPEKVKAE